MGHYWGSFAAGFSQGFQNGWDLGDKITTAMDKADFRNSVRKATDDSDKALADLDSERDKRKGAKRSAPKGKEDSLTLDRTSAIDVGKDSPTSAIDVGKDSPTSAIDLGTGTTYNTDYDSVINDAVASPHEAGIRKYGAGNIPLDERPEHVNADGSTSTVRTMGIDFDGKTVNIPTIDDEGRELTNEQAIHRYIQTGRHLGKFSSQEDADAAAMRLHDDQAQMLDDRLEKRGSRVLTHEADSLNPEPTHALPQYDSPMGTDEYLSRRQAILQDRERSILKAQLRYAERDPEKYAEIQKKLYDLDTDDSIKKVISGMQKGDPEAIGVAVRTLVQVGYLPQGAMPRQGADGAIELVDKDGKVLWNGEITPQMVQQGIPAFAMAAKALADRDYEKVFKIQGDIRTRQREDAQEAREEKRLSHTIANDDRNYALARDQFDYTRDHDAEAMALARDKFDYQKDHDRAAMDFDRDKFDYQKGHDAAVMDFEREKFAHTKDQDAFNNGLAEDKNNTAKIKTNLEWTKMKFSQLQKEGKSGGVGLAQDFKFIADPNDPDGVGQIVQTKDGKTAGRVDPKSGVLIPLADATKEQLAMVTEAAKNGYKPTSVYDPVSKRLEWGWVDQNTGRYSSVAHPGTWFDGAQKQGRLLTVDDIDNITGARMYRGSSPEGASDAGSTSEAPAESKEKVTESKPQTAPEEAASAPQALPQGAVTATPARAIDDTQYRNTKPVSETEPADGILGWIRNRQREALNDTSGYTDAQLKAINAANRARGGQPLKAMDKYPHQEESLSAMSRRRNRYADDHALYNQTMREAPQSGPDWREYGKESHAIRERKAQAKQALKEAPKLGPDWREYPKQEAKAKEQRAREKRLGPNVQPLSESMERTPEGKAKREPRYKNKPGTPTKVTEPLPMNQVTLIHKPGDPIAKDKNKTGGTHSGYTFESTPGQAVFAAKTGRIIYKGEGLGYGPHIIVQAQDGSQQVYAHLETAAKEGDWIRAGKRFAVADKNEGQYGKKNIFFYRNISVEERRAKDKANREYREGGTMKKEIEIGLFDGKGTKR